MNDEENAMTELYVAVYHHEYGVDTWMFRYEPKGKKKYPSPRKVVEHFNINFEAAPGPDVGTDRRERAEDWDRYCRRGRQHRATSD